MSNFDDELKRCEWWSITCDKVGYGLHNIFVTLPTAMGLLKHLRMEATDRIYTLILLEKPPYGYAMDQPFYYESNWHVDKVSRYGR